jgi:hypothetical protein
MIAAMTTSRRACAAGEFNIFFPTWLEDVHPCEVKSLPSICELTTSDSPSLEHSDNEFVNNLVYTIAGSFLGSR